MLSLMMHCGVAINQMTTRHNQIIESSFSDSERAAVACVGHFLVKGLNKLQHDAEVYITHLYQSEAEVTMHEILADMTRFNPHGFINDQICKF